MDADIIHSFLDSCADGAYLSIARSRRDNEVLCKRSNALNVKKCDVTGFLVERQIYYSVRNLCCVIFCWACSPLYLLHHDYFTISRLERAFQNLCDSLGGIQEDLPFG